MRILLLVLLIPSAALSQSIIVSGGRQSITVSGATRAVTTEKEADKAAPAPPVFSEVEPEPQPVRKKPVGQPFPLPVKTQKPILDIHVTSGCAPCNRLKSAISRGELYGVGIRWWNGGASSYPTIVTEDGRRWVGFDESTIPAIRRHLGLSQSASSGQHRIYQVQPSRGYIEQAIPRQVRDQWGTYDPATYRGCGNRNCAMCNARRAVQMGYRQTSFIPADPETLPAGQQPTSPELIDEMLDLMGLHSGDVLADLGCGDGRILIAAVKKTGGRAIGVELDQGQADRARRNVAAAGLSDRITIIEGDALKFDPQSYGVTAITAYLFEELLEQLRPVIQQARVAATPFHQVPGLPMENHGDVWVYRSAENSR